MKNPALIPVLIFFFFSCGNDDIQPNDGLPDDELIEKVFEGDVRLLTQEEVNDFGDAGYTDITGRLSIGHSDDTNNSITSLAKLNNLKSIGGDLVIQNNSLLSSINGLGNCNSIGENLIIKNNDVLESLDGLDEITLPILKASKTKAHLASPQRVK